jgi:magnesium-transporting ATPase (P-type)
MTGIELVSACTLEPNIENEEAKKRLEIRKSNIVDRLQILCRTSPYYTEFLIRLLRDHNRVVAATGSKSQDLEVFDACDVSLSFGLKGSDIAKFKSILVPISFGKNIFRCAMKYLSFLLTAHLTL